MNRYALPVLAALSLRCVKIESVSASAVQEALSFNMVR